MRQSPIFARTYDFLLWLIPRTTKFPREQRFVLAKAAQEAALGFQEALIEAALCGEPERHHALARADVSLAKVRFYLRLCQDLTLINPRQYRHVAEMVTEIGRLLGGWRKKVYAKA
jgi:four helix bundle protein